MAKKKEEDEFKYIVRIATTDIDGNKPVRYALTQIKGISNSMSKLIVQSAGVDESAEIGNLSDKDIEKIDKAIADINEWTPQWMRNRRKDRETGEDKHLIGAEIDLIKREDINLLRKIRAYRGIRHEKGLPVRGQRTRANKRSGLTVGVSRRKIAKKT
ncbi:MAG: 30S ribosomal protein S13 [Candidatus Thermoplasmatota archaeon]|nr:30S ribosomal protein S13 [Candidatus Thermoplasmatota archaeon]